MARSSNPEQRSPSTVVVRVSVGGETREFRFQHTFEIGRTEQCDVCIMDAHVSRTHARVTFTNGEWWLQDLNSSNGIYAAGQKVSSLRLDGRAKVRLGVQGPEISFLIVQPQSEAVLPQKREEVLQPASLPARDNVSQPSSSQPSIEAVVQAKNEAAPETPKPPIDYAARYFGKLDGQPPAGEHTMFIRSAFAQVQRKQKRKYGWVIACLVACALGLATFGYRQYRKASRQREVAEQMFYSMKSLDVDIANLQELVSASNSQQGRAQLKTIESRRAQMEDSYNKFLASLHIYDPNMTEEDRLILRVARIFGECELDMPKDFKSEVERYIKNWQSSQRLALAIKTANDKGYTAVISKDLSAQDLPPQFFYLALQESDFNPYTSGPVTGVGIPKGMWQFTPSTAVKYGLRLGPLVDEQQPDIQDDRDHFDRETVAAGKYLKDLYGSDAEASGLLVMACYNWGQNKVLPLVRSMPPNPRERNFWLLLQKHRDQVPKETYDYVFSIISAAVIGENPHLFGFHFDNPLAGAEKLAQAPSIPTTGPLRSVEAHRKSRPGKLRYTALANAAPVTLSSIGR